MAYPLKLYDDIQMNTTLPQPSNTDSNRLLLKALEKCWRKYSREFKRVRAEFSNEAVHDLRSATRRILTLIQLLNSISPRQRLQKLARAFKEQLDAFDDLRDTQVILAEISEILHELPALDEFQKQLQADELKMLRVLRKRLRKWEIAEIARRIDKTRLSLESSPDADLESQILQAVDDAYLLARQRLEWVDPARSSTIHRIRIAFKAYRYMVEFVHPLLNGFPKENLRKMYEYQFLMGEIQDAEVFAQTLTDFSESVSITDPEPVRRYYENRHAEAISIYLKGMNHLHRFWRPAPDQPFPWEKTQ